MNGREILDSVTDYKGKYIPLIPVYGEQTVVGGVKLTHGKIRFSKDAARILNFLVSSAVEKVALGPGSKILATPEQIAGHSTEWENMNVSRDPVLQYNVLDENGAPLGGAPGAMPPPRYLEPPQPNQMEVLLINDMKTNIYATMGTSGQTVSDGTALDGRPGEAIKAGSVSSDTASFVYLDNLHKSIEHGYVVVNDLLGTIYDTERQVQIVRPDDVEEMVFLNKTVAGPDGLPMVLNDMRRGRFAVSIKTGAAFATQRQEAADRLIELSANDPELRNVANDVIVENLDGPGMDEMARRLKEGKFRTGQLVPTPEEAQELGLDRDQMIVQQARPQIEQEVMQSLSAKQVQATNDALSAKAERDRMEGQAAIIRAQSGDVKAKSDAEVNMSKVDNMDMDTNLKANQANNEYLDGLIKKVQELGLPVTLIDQDNRVGQEDLVELTQLLLDPDLNSNQIQTGNQVRALEQAILQQGGSLPPQGV
jgi:predicted TIM-barrel fold metal-dependent hydrolase